MTAIQITRRDDVLLVELAAPERRNALSRAMLEALAEHLRDPGDGIKGLVLAGRGGSFSAGADFREISGTAEDLTFDDAVTTVREGIQASSLVVVAAIEGPCIGAAADLALACDFRVAAEDGFLAIPATSLGLLYNPDVLARLARTFDSDSLRRMLLLGERLGASDALVHGLVTEVTSTGAAVQRAIELLAGVLPEAGPAIASTKALLASCTSESALDPAWQQKRRELLLSPQRRSAVNRARHRHA